MSTGNMTKIKNPWPEGHKGHWWSGWPGAYCMKCSAEDPMEYAVGMNWYDPITNQWDTEEHRLEYERDMKCLAD